MEASNRDVEFTVEETLAGSITEQTNLVIVIRGFNDWQATDVPYHKGDKYILFLLSHPLGAWSTLDKWHGIYRYNRLRVEHIKRALEERRTVQQGDASDSSPASGSEPGDR